MAKFIQSQLARMRKKQHFSQSLPRGELKAALQLASTSASRISSPKAPAPVHVVLFLLLYCTEEIVDHIIMCSVYVSSELQ